MRALSEEKKKKQTDDSSEQLQEIIQERKKDAKPCVTTGKGNQASVSTNRELKMPVSSVMFSLECGYWILLSHIKPCVYILNEGRSEAA